VLNKIYIGKFLAAFLVACIWTLASNFAGSQEVTEVPPPPPPDAASENDTQEDASAATEAPTTPSPPAGQQSPTVIYALPPGAVIQQQQQTETETDPLVSLRKKPRRLRYVEGEEPPEGYVEVEQRRKGLIIGGAATFGGVWLACMILSSINTMLAIPVVGPMMAGFSYKADSDSIELSDDPEFTARMWGTLGTLVQTTGIVLFIIGMSAKKKVWLRQDIAGLSIHFSPTVVGDNEPGLGIVGTF
jgi:hypothetical protein